MGRKSRARAKRRRLLDQEWHARTREYGRMLDKMLEQYNREHHWHWDWYIPQEYPETWEIKSTNTFKIRTTNHT